MSNFSQLIAQITKLNKEFSNQANKAVNICLTLRNWCVGGYIQEYELNGADRANYGENLMN